MIIRAQSIKYQDSDALLEGCLVNIRMPLLMCAVRKSNITFKAVALRIL